METPDFEVVKQFIQFHFKSHPWHGVSPVASEGMFNVYLELVPTDTVKYEIDKQTGHLKVDRPQKYSSVCPTLYGFIPRTWCGRRVGRITQERTGRAAIEGDHDPLDICVLSERPISHADILVTASPIGGLRLIDNERADDKIIAVLKGDAVYTRYRSVGDLPKGLLDRLRHYFLTYKELPDQASQAIEITHVYDREESLEVIRAAMDDYAQEFGEPERSLIEFLRYVTEHSAGK